MTAFGGYLWIGRGKLAVCFWVAIMAITIALMCAIVFGFVAQPFLANWAAGDVTLFLGIFVGLLSISLVLPMRPAAMPARWYSRGWWVVLLTAIGLAASIFAFLLYRSLAVQTFTTPASSMAPTLIVGDHFAISKWAYGYNDSSFPFPVGLAEVRIMAAAPQRGDLVVFKYPADRKQDYVKRVIGLPGERVQLIGGIVHINGVPLNREPVDLDIAGIEPEGAIYRETLPEGGSYLTIDLQPGAQLDDTPDYLVPENSYFVMGDHRDNSADSRVFGFVDASLLVGRAERIYWNANGVSIDGRTDLRISR